MARQPRIVYPGAYYHVMARGNQRQVIVRDDEDRGAFVKMMEEVVGKTGWRVLAWVLLDNHYHWVIQTPEPNLVEGMKWFQNTYTRRFSARHGAWGHLFGGRYKAIVVDPEEERGGRRAEYLPALMDYVHLNHVRAGLVKPGEGLSLMGYRWSSLATGYGCPVKERLGWMAVEEGLALSGLADTARDRRRFVERLDNRARLEGEESGRSATAGQTLHSTLQRGWYWGRQSFGEAMARRLQATGNRNYRSSAVGRRKARQEAEELLREGLAHFGLARTKNWERASHRARVAIAWALTRRTSQSQAWIAEELGLRSAANVSQLTLRFERERPVVKEKEMAAWIKMSRYVD
jgi:putative transposase